MDTRARSAGTGIAMMRDSWVSASGLPKELQNVVQDLPFGGKDLFNDTLHLLTDSQATLRSLSLYISNFKR